VTLPLKTGLTVPLLDADELLRPWRERHDPTAHRMPAHVTLRFPWLADPSQLDVAQLRELVAAVEVHDLVLRRWGRFAATLYLIPEPTGPLETLAAAVDDRWPRATGSYGYVPHVTVADEAGPDRMDAVEAGLAPVLPVQARAAELWLMVRRAPGRYEPAERIPLGRAA